MQTRLKQKGFTLVEIAIVLVIIGLLLGGILKGQEMITQARIKNVINDFNGLTAAYASYQDRYRAIPGDDQGAIARWGGAGGQVPTLVAGSGGNANGNGLLDNPAGAGYNAPTVGNEPETRLFWWHLRIAGFIPGATAAPQGANQPTNAFGGLIGSQNGAGAGTLGLSGLIVCSAGVPDKVAIAVDTQIDDQSSAGGSLRAMLGNSTTVLGAAVAAYQELGTNTYVICKGV